MMRQDSGGRHHVPSPSRGQDTLFQFRTAKLLNFLRTVKSFRAMKKNPSFYHIPKAEG